MDRKNYEHNNLCNKIEKIDKFDDELELCDTQVYIDVRDVPHLLDGTVYQDGRSIIRNRVNMLIKSRYKNRLPDNVKLLEEDDKLYHFDDKDSGVGLVWIEDMTTHEKIL